MDDDVKVMDPDGDRRHAERMRIARAAGKSFYDRMIETVLSARVVSHHNCTCWSCLMRRGKQRRRARSRRDRGSEAGK